MMRFFAHLQEASDPLLLIYVSHYNPNYHTSSIRTWLEIECLTYDLRRFYDPVFPKREMLGNFCTVNPDNYTEAKLNYLKLMRKYFGI